MCLAIPGKIVKIKGSEAVIKQGDHNHKVGVTLVPDLKKGDWVICNQNMVLAKLSEEEAEEKLKIIRQLNKKGGE